MISPAAVPRVEKPENPRLDVTALFALGFAVFPWLFFIGALVARIVTPESAFSVDMKASFAACFVALIGWILGSMSSTKLRRIRVFERPPGMIIAVAATWIGGMLVALYVFAIASLFIVTIASG